MYHLYIETLLSSPMQHLKNMHIRKQLCSKMMKMIQRDFNRKMENFSLKIGERRHLNSREMQPWQVTMKDSKGENVQDAGDADREPQDNTDGLLDKDGEPCEGLAGPHVECSTSMKTNLQCDRVKCWNNRNSRLYQRSAADKSSFWYDLKLCFDSWSEVVHRLMVVVVVVSQFNGTSTPKGSYSAKTGDNDRNVNSRLQSKYCTV